jgi:hypothetical protein
MTPSTEEAQNWQSMYTAEKNHWDDLAQLGLIVLPLAAGVAFAALYAALFVNFILDPLITWSANSSWAFIAYLIVLFFPIILPVILVTVGLSRLMKLARTFFESFYNTDDTLDVRPLIRRRFLGIPPVPPSPISAMEYPYVVIPESGQIKPEQKWVKWLGGPANLVISDGVAVYLERGHKFSRVVGSGIVFLEKYETVHSVIQITPQKRDDDLKASTKDGIPPVIKARIVFWVGLEEQKESDKRLYALDPLAVKKAVEKTTLRYGEKHGYQESHWYDSVWGPINGPIKQYITSHCLDEFFVADQSSENTFPELLQKKLFDEVTPKLEDLGVRLLELQITEIKPPEDVDKQRIQNWEAVRQSKATIKEGVSKAYQIRTVETARALAQRDLILAIADGLDKMDQEHLEEPLLISLSAILDQSLSDSYTRSLIANDALDTLENLKKLL